MTPLSTVAYYKTNNKNVSARSHLDRHTEGKKRTGLQAIGEEIEFKVVVLGNFISVTISSSLCGTYARFTPLNVPNAGMRCAWRSRIQPLAITSENDH
mmetsp:Transcript_119758/g.189571  ORF Transcript_119758/g.189571 Transcript_119758/m.189571 type:complete len:98 (-) Transcript_119758:231-524(-)